MNESKKQPLTKKQELRLVKRAQAGAKATAELQSALEEGRELSPESQRKAEFQKQVGLKARDELVERNRGLVWKFVNQIWNDNRPECQHGLEKDDCVQAGLQALNKAIDKFNDSKGYRFTTYAGKWIEGAIRKELRDKGRTIRLKSEAENAQKVLEASARLEETLGHKPMTREISIELTAEGARIPPEKVCELLTWSKDLDSLDKAVKEGGDEDSATLYDFIEGKDAPNPTRSLDQSELRNALAEVLATLNENEQAFIDKRFGLSGDEPLELDELGEELGCSTEAARRMECKALSKLRHPSRASRLEDFIECTV